MSAIASLPPGQRTRAISAKTRCLTGERLAQQNEPIAADEQNGHSGVKHAERVFGFGAIVWTLLGRRRETWRFNGRSSRCPGATRTPARERCRAEAFRRRWREPRLGVRLSPWIQATTRPLSSTKR